MKSNEFKIQIFYVLTIFLYVFFIQNLPLSILLPRVHDDALFISQAQSLIRGDLLGSYNQLTLAKGPVYSYFLAFSNLLGLPINLTQSVFYIVTTSLLIRSLRNLGLNREFASILFAALLFLPELFPVGIIRDNIDPPLLYLVIFSLIELIYLDTKKHSFSFSIYGFAGGLFYINREDALWIMPGIIFLIITNILLFKIFNRRQDIELIKIKIKKILLYIFGGIFAIVVIGGLNFNFYGSFEFNELKEKEFLGVINKLSSINAGEELPYVSVQKSKRDLAYEISPSFLVLKKYFEVDGLHWQEFGCLYHREACGDYGAGWFLFALRDAAATNGHYQTPNKAKEFYSKINHEIDQACKSGKISCSPSIISLIPKLTSHQINEIPLKIFETIKASVKNIPRDFRSYSYGTTNDLIIVKDFLGGPRIMAPPSSPETADKLLDSYNRILPLKIEKSIIYIYNILMPLLLLVGTICYLISAFRLKKDENKFFVVSTFFLILYISKITEIALVDISSFPALNNHYLKVCFPLIFLFSTSSIYATYNLLHSKKYISRTELKKY
jgi:hypothetical protein